MASRRQKAPVRVIDLPVLRKDKIPPFGCIMCRGLGLTFGVIAAPWVVPCFCEAGSRMQSVWPTPGEPIEFAKAVTLAERIGLSVWRAERVRACRMPRAVHIPPPCIAGVAGPRAERTIQ